MWAQNQNQDVGGKWSWQDARDYFYRGLGFNVKTGRDLYFARTFRALGQLMHLIQDASVPSHARNDIHVIYHYESWVEDVRNNWSGKFNSWISSPKTYDRSILNLSPNPSAPIPIANVVDTDKYTRENQDIESTKSSAIGLAEYSNGNFFSEDTCFAGWYPYPNWACVETVPYTILDPRNPLRTVSREYYKKDPTVACGETNGGLGYRLATVEFLKDYVLTYFPTWVTHLRAFKRPALDANVYGDYASLLMPRAVGYSAGLLEYFFRGKIEITDPIIEGFPDRGYTKVKLKARNTTPTNEEMPGGDNAIINLVVKFKIPSETEYLYLVASEAKEIKSIPRDEPVELEFVFEHLLQANATDINLQVVYKGTLGLEENNAVAVGLKDINVGIEISLPEDGVYAQTENRDQGFARITLLAKNTTPKGEEMTDGSIELMVKYKLALQDPFQPVPVPTTDDFFYLVIPEANNTRSIPRANPIELVFDLPQNNPIPINATDLYLQVVYKGNLGKVEGDVWKGELDAVAVGFKDISEPTSIDIYNDMDRVCLNGNWYVAGSPEAIAQVDTNNDGRPDLADPYAHDLKNNYVRFSSAASPQNASSTEYNLHIPLLGAGEYFIRRAFVLSDYEFSYGYMVGQVVNKDPNDPYVRWYEPEIYPYKGVKNQTEPGTPEQCMALDRPYPCNVRYYPNRFYSFRGQQIWEWVVFQNSSYPSDSSCPLE
jgi:hypothetical protein